MKLGMAQQLPRMAALPPSSLQGLAAEYLVAADLTKQGYPVSMAAPGLPYDLLADIGGRVLRVQVKSCKKPLIASGAKEVCYKFRLKGAITSTVADLIALVACDISFISYVLPSADCAYAVLLKPPGAANNAWSKKHYTMADLTLAKALEALNASAI